MFTPIKNLITYIQKNASGAGNTIFGNSNSSPEIKKMETENLNTCIDIAKIKESQTDIIATNMDKEVTIEGTLKAPQITDCTNAAALSPSSLRVSPRRTITSSATSTNSIAMACATETTMPSNIVIDDDDIESQLDASIMLKKPVKRPRTNGTEILEVKKSLKSKGRSIYISHDYNRNRTVTSPLDDELEDFRYDPTESTMAEVSTPETNQRGNDNDECFLEVENKETENIINIDSATECVEVEDNFEDCEDDMESVQIVEDININDEVVEINDNDSMIQSEEEFISIDVESERCRNISALDNELQSVEEANELDAEESFLEINNFPDCEVIVIGDINSKSESVTPTPLDTSTSDDPLAIACDEQEAFAADRSAALEELNLLNSSNNSQDEDTRTTAADEDLQWLRVDTQTGVEDNGQPSCSKTPGSVNIVSTETTPEKEERNGEGSDSGLGSETSALHLTNSSLGDTSQLNITVPDALGASSSQTPHDPTPRKSIEKDKSLVQNLSELNGNSKSPLNVSPSPKPLRSNLKRRLEVDDEVVDSLDKLTPHTTSSNSILSSTASSTSSSGGVQKKPKRSINFDSVQVFYFPRQQGFGCVPSAGGCTLGMGARHVAFKTLTLAEHAAELRRAHRMQLQEINPRGSSSDDSEESEEDYLSEGSGSDLDGESNGFLQPVSPKQRRAILKAAGVRKIDASEKAECRDIRNSREVCGCSCRDFCDPETCACSQSGIKCQVDRDMFPCGCNRDACGNTIGRVEFNPARVRTHFIHTLMRLEMENRQQQNPYSPAVAGTTTGVVASTVTPVTFYQSTHLQQQPQSNYSSGYASPAYNSTVGMADMHQANSINNSFYHQQQATPVSGSNLYCSGNTTHAVNGVPTPYGLDSLDSGLFVGGAPGATPSYGDLMPVTSYHHNISYGNVSTDQMPPYNTYNPNTSSYMNNVITDNNISNTPTTYSSCAVPSLPPYGTATTTEASVEYQSVNTLSSLETTIAPSCPVSSGGETLDADGDGTSFISLSTPLASSSRLSQINDLLHNNRNATTALVAISHNDDELKNNLQASCTSPEHSPGMIRIVSESMSCHLNTSSISSCSLSNTNSINTPPTEDSQKSCIVYEDLTLPAPLRPSSPKENVKNQIGSDTEVLNHPSISTATISVDISQNENQTNTIVLNLAEVEEETLMPMIDAKPETSPLTSPTIVETVPLKTAELLIEEPKPETETSSTHSKPEIDTRTTTTAFSSPTSMEDNKESVETTAPIEVAFDSACIEVAAGN